jgi:hypothetical protein
LRVRPHSAATTRADGGTTLPRFSGRFQAIAGTPVETSFPCPVGGETFAIVRVASGRRDEAADRLARFRPLAEQNADLTRDLHRLAARHVDWRPEACSPDAPSDRCAPSSR